MKEMRSLRRKKSRSAQASFKNRVGFMSGLRVTVSRAQGKDIGEALMELAEPYFGWEQDHEAAHKAIMMAVMAWNTALLPAEKWAEEIEEIAETIPDCTDDLKEYFGKIMREMAQRKLSLFRDLRQVVMAYEVRETSDDQLYIAVAAMPLESQD